MSDESRHRVHRGRPLRSVQTGRTTQSRADARTRGGMANVRTPVVFDWDAAIERLKAMLDDLEDK